MKRTPFLASCKVSSYLRHEHRGGTAHLNFVRAILSHFIPPDPHHPPQERERERDQIKGIICFL